MHIPGIQHSWSVPRVDVGGLRLAPWEMLAEVDTCLELCAVSPHLMSSRGSVALSEAVYSESTFTIG